MSLENVKKGDVLSLWNPGFFGNDPLAIPCQVEEIDSEYIRVRFLSDVIRSAKFYTGTGLSEHDDPSYGFITSDKMHKEAWMK